MTNDENMPPSRSLYNSGSAVVTKGMSTPSSMMNKPPPTNNIYSTSSSSKQGLNSGRGDDHTLRDKTGLFVNRP